MLTWRCMARRRKKTESVWELCGTVSLGIMSAHYRVEKSKVVLDFSVQWRLMKLKLINDAEGIQRLFYACDNLPECEGQFTRRVKWDDFNRIRMENNHTSSLFPVIPRSKSVLIFFFQMGFQFSDIWNKVYGPIRFERLLRFVLRHKMCGKKH